MKGWQKQRTRKLKNYGEKKMKQNINFFNVWTKTPTKDKRNEDAIDAEENVQSPTKDL